MATINPYLTFNGNAAEAMNFYKSVFGGDFMGGISLFKDMPDSENLSAADGEKVMHVSLPIGKDCHLMASDTIEGMGPPFTPGNNFSIAIQVENEEESRRLFNGLSAGGQVTMPLDKTFWAELFGMFTDKFGIQWMVSYDLSQQ
jgi:PhnB protein